MDSKTKRILKTRQDLIDHFLSYIFLARQIDDLETEDDFDQLESAIDGVLERLVVD